MSTKEPTHGKEPPTPSDLNMSDLHAAKDLHQQGIDKEETTTKQGVPSPTKEQETIHKDWDPSQPDLAKEELSHKKEGWHLQQPNLVDKEGSQRSDKKEASQQPDPLNKESSQQQDPFKKESSQQPDPFKKEDSDKKHLDPLHKEDSDKKQLDPLNKEDSLKKQDNEKIEQGLKKEEEEKKELHQQGIKKEEEKKEEEKKEEEKKHEEKKHEEKKAEEKKAEEKKAEEKKAEEKKAEEKKAEEKKAEEKKAEEKKEDEKKEDEKKETEKKGEKKEDDDHNSKHRHKASASTPIDINPQVTSTTKAIEATNSVFDASTTSFFRGYGIAAGHAEDEFGGLGLIGVFEDTASIGTKMTNHSHYLLLILFLATWFIFNRRLH